MSGLPVMSTVVVPDPEMDSVVASPPAVMLAAPCHAPSYRMCIA
jgi:hypothetical protein